MKRRELMILTGVIATLALAQTSSAAGLLGTNIGGSGTKAGVSANVGGGSGVSANIGGTVGSGAGTAASGNVNIGGDPGTNARARVNLGGATAAQPLAARANLTLGSRTLRATVDLNGDGLINGEDDAYMALDINGDGILNVLDDVNGDGLLSTLDLEGVDVGDLSIGTITLPAVGALIGDGGSNTFTPPPGGGEPLPGFDPNLGSRSTDISRALGNLDDNDVASLKVKCAAVLGNPGGFDAATVSVCQVLASL